MFVPAAILSFVGLPDFRPTDHGGSIAMNVAGGAATLGVLLVTGNAPTAQPRSASLPLGVIAVIVLCVGWIGWLVGAGRHRRCRPASCSTPPGAVTGMLGWLIVQQFATAHDGDGRRSRIVSGLVAITAGAALYRSQPRSRTSSQARPHAFTCGELGRPVASSGSSSART